MSISIDLPDRRPVTAAGTDQDTLGTDGTHSDDSAHESTSAIYRSCAPGETVLTAPLPPSSPDQPTGGPSPAPSITDELLFDQYRRGDRASFGRLMERYQRELFHFLIRFLGDRAAAEDIFQETFLQVHQSAAGFDIQRRFRPWLFTIAANKARDLRRSRGRRLTAALQNPVNGADEQGSEFMDLMSGHSELPSDSLEREELAKRVRSTVMEMPESLREILLLSYFDQFPYKQIGDILGIPLGTVKSRLHTAVADFANRWKTVNKIRRMS
jgi:RNA polymerase sigma-70 factor (ECF subfamily)